MIKVGECERRLGAAEREFIQTSAISFLSPLRNFLEGDWRTISVSVDHIHIVPSHHWHVLTKPQVLDEYTPILKYIIR